MLVLQVKVGDSIYIADNIRVKVIRDLNGSIKLGIDAPIHIPVHREKVMQAIAKRNKEE